MARGLKCGGAWECLLCYRDSLCCCEGVKSLGPLKNVEADCALTLLWDYALLWELWTKERRRNCRLVGGSAAPAAPGKSQGPAKALEKGTGAFAEI